VIAVHNDARLVITNPIASNKKGPSDYIPIQNNKILITSTFHTIKKFELETMQEYLPYASKLNHHIITLSPEYTCLATMFTLSGYYWKLQYSKFNYQSRTDLTGTLQEWRAFENPHIRWHSDCLTVL
jgi:hypothetical protein